MGDIKEAPTVELGEPFEGDYFVGPPPGVSSQDDPSRTSRRPNPWRSPSSKQKHQQLRNRYNQIETELNSSIENGEGSVCSQSEPVEYRPFQSVSHNASNTKSSRKTQYQRQATRRSQASSISTPTESTTVTDAEHEPPASSRQAISVNNTPVPAHNNTLQSSRPSSGLSILRPSMDSPPAHATTNPTISNPSNITSPVVNVPTIIPRPPRFAGGPNFTTFGSGRPQTQDMSVWSQRYLNYQAPTNQLTRSRIIVPPPAPNVWIQPRPTIPNQIQINSIPQPPVVRPSFAPLAQPVNSAYTDFLKNVYGSIPGIDVDAAIRQWQANPHRPIQVPVSQNVDINSIQSQVVKQLEDIIAPALSSSNNSSAPKPATALLSEFVNQFVSYNRSNQQQQQQHQQQQQQQAYQPVGNQPTQPRTNVPSAEDEMARQDELAQADQDDEYHEVETYADYVPAKLSLGKPHPDPVVETSSLSTVEPPDIEYELVLPKKVIDSGSLSALQLESVIYACQQHEETLPDKITRRGFLIGDGAGVGKGRTIAGIIYENFLRGRRKSIWLSVSPDLKHDAERDLRDIGANIQVYYLNKFQYGKRIDKQPIDGRYVDRGVLFSTYSGLVSKSQSVKGSLGTRIGQLTSWVGNDFDGVIVFDECHRAKNISMSKSAKKLSKSAEFVLELQQKLPNARIVYASATGASETRHLGYMARLGIWGVGTPYSTFSEFHEAIEKRGVGAMELVAVDLKMRGAYIARQLSFKTTSFEIKIAPLNDEFINLYDECCEMWALALKHFYEADQYFMGDKKLLRSMWSAFWAAHQKFFKYLCISAKVPLVTEIAKEALQNDKCVVIGLQSTGEAKTLEALDGDKNLSEFVSTARATFESLIDNHFPAPPRSRRSTSAESELSFCQALTERTTTNCASSGSSSSTTVDDSWLRDDSVKFFVQDGIVKPSVSESIATRESARKTNKKKQKLLQDLVEAKKSQNVRSDRTLRAKRRASMRQSTRRSRIQKLSDDSSENGSSILSSSQASLFDSSSEDTKDKFNSDETYSSELDDDDNDDETLTGTSNSELDEISTVDAKPKPKILRNVVNDDSDSDIEILGTIKPTRRNPDIIFLSDDDDDNEEYDYERSDENPMNKYRTRLCEMRDELLAKLDALSSRLPNNTLDDLIDRLGGPEKVAEMTGRKGRVVKDADGRISYAQRKADKSDIDQLDTMNMLEKDRFMRGEKLIAIISEAASSGISLQADRRVKNIRRRVHITIELPWSADRAIQQFGRTHRSNQLSGPEYVFLISELSGERRFASIVAKRLESLGALTHGDRRASTESRDLSQFNVASKYSRLALDLLNRYLETKEPFANIKPAYKHGNFVKDAREAYYNTGLAKSPSNHYFLLEPFSVNINVFLNRILGMKVHIQNAIFKLFTDIVDRLITRKKVAGLFDAGILELNSDSGKAHCDEPEKFSLPTQAGLLKCTLRNVKVERGISWQEALQILEKSSAEDKRQGFYMSSNSVTGKKLAFLVIKEGVDTFRIYKPNTGRQPKLEFFSQITERSKHVSSDDAKSIWCHVYDNTDKNCVHICLFDSCKRIENKMTCDVGLRHRYYCILSGGILTIWPFLERKLPEATRKIQIVRLKLDDKNRVIGPVIPQDCLAKVRDILHEAESTGIQF